MSAKQGIDGARAVGTKRLLARRPWRERVRAHFHCVRVSTSDFWFPMFRVKSSFKAKFEIKAPLDQVRTFFADLRHFTDFLGGVESIRREPGGVMRWTIATDTPVGLVRMSL